MKTLRDLNDDAATNIEFTDDRAAGVYFDRDPSTVLSSITKKGNSILTPFVPMINVVDIVDYAAVGLEVTVELNSPTVGETFDTTNIPTYLTVDETVANEITFGGFRSSADWDWLVTNFKIDMNSSEYLEIDYTVTITDDIIGYNISYDVTYQISSDVFNITGVETGVFSRNATRSFTGPTVIDRGFEPTYTITLTPSNTSMVTTLASAGSGGTSSFNGGTKVLTITGTRIQVNTHLTSLSITAPDVDTVDFDIAYNLDENEWNGNTSIQLLIKDIK